MGSFRNGTGESRVSALPEETYLKLLSDMEVDTLVHCACKYFGVETPYIWQKNKRNGYGGTYDPKTYTIALSHNYLGLLLHELAHHIAFIQHKCYAHTLHRSVEFNRALETLYDIWARG